MERYLGDLWRQFQIAIYILPTLLACNNCWCQSVTTHTIFTEFAEDGVKYMVPIEYSDTLKSSVNSPDKRVAAAVVVRDVGATADFSTIVNLRRADEKLDVDGDTKLDPNRGPRDNPANVFSAKGLPEVTLRWISATSLAIVCKPSCKTFTKRSKWKNINISYPKK